MLLTRPYLRRSGVSGWFAFEVRMIELSAEHDAGPIDPEAIRDVQDRFAQARVAPLDPIHALMNELVVGHDRTERTFWIIAVACARWALQNFDNADIDKLEASYVALLVATEARWFALLQRIDASEPKRRAAAQRKARSAAAKRGRAAKQPVTREDFAVRAFDRAIATGAAKPAARLRAEAAFRAHSESDLSSGYVNRAVLKILIASGRWKKKRPRGRST